MSGIEWTGKDRWNPVVGCTPVSAGCANCYAVPMSHRLGGMAIGKVQRGEEPGKLLEYYGLTVLQSNGKRAFNGKVRCVESEISKPLRWKKPRKVFVNSMADLFHEDVPFDFIDRVFAVMALCPQHTFQVLTKRPERMAEYLTKREVLPGSFSRKYGADWVTPANKVYGIVNRKPRSKQVIERGMMWPLPNVWLGTSVEDQATADERIPHLLRCPAAVRFLSCEPLLGEVVLPEDSPACDIHGLHFDRIDVESSDDRAHCKACHERDPEATSSLTWCYPGVDWVIVGGESGPGARACGVDWIRSIVEQCKEAGTACFVKQLGAQPVLGDVSDPHGWPVEGGPVDWEAGEINLRSKKGSDPSEWPEDLRVREFPGCAGANENAGSEQ
ncbi:phage Gp37/Gp68 family protein [Planctomycetaceae bacterium AH-315-I19]|nr:phage Gp37/Gp68 family protein [Planctomycetaceae bacterium AH-315-I19]